MVQARHETGEYIIAFSLFFREEMGNREKREVYKCVYIFSEEE